MEYRIDKLVPYLTLGVLSLKCSKKVRTKYRHAQVLGIVGYIIILRTIPYVPYVPVALLVLYRFLKTSLRYGLPFGPACSTAFRPAARH